MDITGKKKIEVFCCYAREDRELLLGFEKHLKPLERQGLISLWSDRDLNAGVEWENEVKKHLNSAQIVLLFVSPDFMQSDYAYSNEMMQAMKRHESGETKVIPIILRPVGWQDAPFAKLQALPQDGHPIISSKWNYPDEGYADATEGIRRLVVTLFAKEEQHFSIEEEQQRNVVEEDLSLSDLSPIRESAKTSQELPDDGVLEAKSSTKENQTSTPGKADQSAHNENEALSAKDSREPISESAVHLKLQRPGQKALGTWQRLLSPEKMEEIQQFIKFPRPEKEIQVWIQGNQRLLSPKKMEELQVLITFLCSEEEVNVWLETNKTLLSLAKMKEIQQIIEKYSRNSLNVQNLFASNRDPKTLVANIPDDHIPIPLFDEDPLFEILPGPVRGALPIPRGLPILRGIQRVEEIEWSKLIEFLDAEKTVKAWIEENQKLLSFEVIEEVQQLIENFRPLSFEAIEEIQQLWERRIAEYRANALDSSIVQTLSTPSHPARIARSYYVRKPLSASSRSARPGQMAAQEKQNIRDNRSTQARLRTARISQVRVGQGVQNAQGNQLSSPGIFLAGAAVLVFNLLGTSVVLGILLHAWWIAVVCLIGEALLIFFSSAFLGDGGIKLLVPLLPIGIAWGFVGWFLFLAPGPAAVSFLLGLFVNFFIYLWLVRRS